MRIEQIMLLAAGLMIAGAFFLPFLTYEFPVIGETQLSGYSITRTILDEAGVSPYEDKKLTSDFFTDLIKENTTWKEYLSIFGMLFTILGPFFYLLFGLGYLFKSFLGKSYKRGIWFNLLFLAIGWASFWWTSQLITEKINNSVANIKILDKLINPEVSVNFFQAAGVGFWLCFAAIFIAGFSLIFEKQK
ncbi:MAG: hypothetical protein MRZ79_18665 [Bacteroidia bacterium]|nr:hypothetical protein [Bacteroidia bacterium]